MHDEFAVRTQLTLPFQSESVGRKPAWMASMRSIRTALWIALAGGLALPAAGIQAQTESSVKIAQATFPPTQWSPPPPGQQGAPRHVRRPLRRVPIYRSNEGISEQGIYPYYNPGPNAVRDCVANYVQEDRPSGTVIVPRMHCHWRPSERPY
jgi:hypothetical protein